jgi:O-antigen ligase
MKDKLLKFSLGSVFILLSLAYILWFLDLFKFFGIKFFENFFIAAGLYSYEQYLYIFIISLLSIPSFIYLVFFNNKVKINLEILGFLFLSVVAFISTLFFSIEVFDSVREFLIMFLILLFMIFGYNIFRFLKDQDGFFYNFNLFLVILLILLIFIAIFVNLGMPPNSSWMSFFYQKNAFAGYLLILLPVPFSLTVLSLIYREFYKATLFFLAFLFAIVALFFSGSKAAILSFFISLPLYFGLFKIFRKIYLDLKDIKLEKRTLIFIFATISFVIFVLLLQFLLDRNFINSLFSSFRYVLSLLANTVLARIDFYLASFSIAKDFPFGCGLYNFSKTYPLYQSAFYFYSKDPHNYYLKILSEIGFLGFISLIFIFSSFLFRISIFYTNFIKNVDFTKLKEKIDKLLEFLSNQTDNNDNNNLNELIENEIRDLRNLNIVVLSSGLSIGLIQSMIHIAFDVDFKFAFVLITFFVIFAINLGSIDFVKNEIKYNDKFSYDFNNLFKILFLIFIGLGIIFSIIFSYKELKAYYLDKLANNSSSLDEAISYYHKIIKSSFKSSSKYINLAEFYRAKGDYINAEIYNQLALKVSKYNLNAYISLAYCYLQEFEIKYNVYNSIMNSKNLSIDLKNQRDEMLKLLKNIRKVLKDAIYYDKYNYPDVYLLIAKSYYYEQLINKKDLYSLRLFRNIFENIYPLNELGFLMDVRKPNFYSVVLEAYDYYIDQDFNKCLLIEGNKNYISNCKKVFNVLYKPLILYDLSNVEDKNIYIKGGVVSYILGKYYLNQNNPNNQIYFKDSINLFSKADKIDIISVYYTVMSLFYLNDLNSAYNIASSIVKINKDEEDFKIIKTEMYSVLAQIYNVKKFIYYNPSFSNYYLNLYKKYNK